jgi:hypothetical protein
MCALISGRVKLPEEIWSFSKGCPPLPPTPPPPPTPSLNYRSVPRPWEPPQTYYCSLHLDISKNRGIRLDFFSLKVKNSIPRNWVCQRSKTIAVEGTIFAFGFSKKYDISLLSIECLVLDAWRVFDRIACVDAHLCSTSSLHFPSSSHAALLRL